MIRHLWSVLCASSAIDRDENRLSLFDITEQITVLEPVTEPGIMPVRLHLVTLWRRKNLTEGAKSTARVRVIAPPNGEAVGKAHEYTIDLTKFVRLRQRMVFRTLPLQAEGTYEFVIELMDADGWREVARVPLDIAVKFSAPTPDAKAETTTH